MKFPKINKFVTMTIVNCITLFQPFIVIYGHIIKADLNICTNLF